MNIYVEILKGQDNSGFQQLIILPAPNEFKLCDSSDDADIVVVGSKSQMEELMNAKKFFLIISHEEVKNMPENAFWISAESYEEPMVELFEKFMA